MTFPGISFTPAGREPLHLFHLVLDYNGTLACRGRLLPGVAERLRALGRLVAVHVVTFDTFGTVRAQLAGELGLAEAGEGGAGGVSLDVMERGAGGEAEAKLAFLQGLGPASCCAVGNGVNDSLMLEAAALSICVMGREGCAVESMLRSDICVADINDALDLLLYPDSCVATLRR